MFENFQTDRSVKMARLGVSRNKEEGKIRRDCSGNNKLSFWG